ncbi:esterase E4-like [Atheta coriaria]|uniref:esterase E4-like n=1 Tax=Dalotia coriaria TaxID=877792 RepID=UPI0031F46F23
MCKLGQIAFAFYALLACVYGVPVSKTTSLHSAYPTIASPLGDIQGSIINSRLGKHIYAFRGIRYAKAPINELRFQPPQAPEKWEGVYNATQDGPACPQPYLEPTSEDCLLLNVYTTKLNKGNDNPKRPVIVFFHGGDFTNKSGMSTILGPHYLLDQDIVLVTANYRLGALGFLNTGDKEGTGNYGMKDQVEVLKWVKANIAAFGGDADEVTLAGHGAGAFSVSLHLVSPLSKGLFNKAIIMSGSAFGNVPISNNNLDVIQKLAKHLSCPIDSTANLIKCLRGKTVKEITDHNVDLKVLVSTEDPHYLWLPTIEEDFVQSRFLTAHPLELIAQEKLNKVPVLIGSTKDEFGCKAFCLTNNDTELQLMDNEFEKYAPQVFMYEKETENSKIISKALRTFYLQDAKIDNSSLSKLALFFTDAIVGYGVNHAANVIAEKSNESVFYYSFTYAGKYSNFYDPTTNNSTPYGVVNGDDLMYLFHSTSFPDFKESDPETTMLQKMTALWANFVQSGKPIPTVTDILDNTKWEPYTTKNKKYMEIGNKLVMRENLNEKRYSEWDQVFPPNRHTKVQSG